MLIKGNCQFFFLTLIKNHPVKNNRMIFIIDLLHHKVK